MLQDWSWCVTAHALAAWAPPNPEISMISTNMHQTIFLNYCNMAAQDNRHVTTSSGSMVRVAAAEADTQTYSPSHSSKALLALVGDLISCLVAEVLLSVTHGHMAADWQVAESAAAQR